MVHTPSPASSISNEIGLPADCFAGIGVVVGLVRAGGDACRIGRVRRIARPEVVEERPRPRRLPLHAGVEAVVPAHQVRVAGQVEGVVDERPVARPVGPVGILGVDARDDGAARLVRRGARDHQAAPRERGDERVVGVGQVRRREEVRPPALGRRALVHRRLGTGAAQQRVGLVARSGDGDVEGRGGDAFPEAEPAREGRVRLAGRDRRAAERTAPGIVVRAAGLVAPALPGATGAHGPARVEDGRRAHEEPAREGHEVRRQVEARDGALRQLALMRAHRRVVEAHLVAVVTPPRAEGDVDTGLRESVEDAVAPPCGASALPAGGPAATDSPGRSRADSSGHSQAGTGGPPARACRTRRRSRSGSRAPSPRWERRGDGRGSARSWCRRPSCHREPASRARGAPRSGSPARRDRAGRSGGAVTCSPSARFDASSTSTSEVSAE